MKMTLQGDKELIKALRKLGTAGEKHAKTAVFATAFKIDSDAKKAIANGPKTGRVYTEIFRTINGRVVPVGERAGNNLSASHQASAPGEAPASDTGRLIGSGKATSDGLSATVNFAAKYAEWLEFGTVKMAERPFLRPAVEVNKQFFRDRLSLAIERATAEVSK